MTTAQRRESSPPALPAPRGLPTAVIGAAHPLTGGAAPFNEAMVRAMRQTGAVEFIGWRHMYPPLLHRGQTLDTETPPPAHEPADRMLDWHDPLTWRRAVERLEVFGAEVLVLPWLHPVMAPPFRWLLRHAPKGTARVVICHNVEPHERTPLARSLTRGVLRHADLLVTHAPHQRREIESLGLADPALVEAFHPMLLAEHLAVLPSPDAVRAERNRLGDPEVVLLAFGAVRPYKGVDIAVEAMRYLPRSLRAKLVVAGRFWGGSDELRARVRELGVEDRVEIDDAYQSNAATALRFLAADAAVLPYRSASQSGVVALAFGHGKPVVATRVGGLPQAVREGVDGLLCPPEDPRALANAIARMAADPGRFAAGVAETRRERSFERYVALIDAAVRAR